MSLTVSSGFDNYFNISDDFSKIEIKENTDKNNCYIQEVKGLKLYKGFILLDNPKVKTVCEIQFYKSKVQNKYIPRPTFKKVDKENKVIEREATKPLIVGFNNSEEADCFWRLIGFLNQFKETIDLGEFSKSYKVIHKEGYFIEFESKTEKEKIADIIELIKASNISEKNLKEVVLNTRKKIINTFYKLLKNEPTKGSVPIELYRTYFKIKTDGDEIVWHHFLKEHDWILGLNVDIKFIREFVHQVDLGITNTKGTGSPEGDILGISTYTILIELKTAATDIFKLVKKSGDGSRANTWAFSPDFINGISQCLGQKFDWDVSHLSKPILDSDKKIVNQNENRTLDTKTVFIIGNRNQEFPHNTDPNCILKSETFERFRRNSRNIDIITFDELFERAYHIVFEEKIDKNWWSNPSFKIEI
jgi:hypothetical protein